MKPVRPWGWDAPARETPGGPRASLTQLGRAASSPWGWGGAPGPRRQPCLRAPAALGSPDLPRGLVPPEGAGAHSEPACVGGAASAAPSAQLQAPHRAPGKAGMVPQGALPAPQGTHVLALSSPRTCGRALGKARRQSLCAGRAAPLPSPGWGSRGQVSGQAHVRECAFTLPIRRPLRGERTGMWLPRQAL